MMKGIKTIFTIVVFLSVLSGCALIKTKKEESQLPTTTINQETIDPMSKSLPKLSYIPVVFSKSIDGDTSEFLLDGQPVTVRYLLIDTPESVKKDTPVQPFGMDASNRTKVLLEGAETITIMLDEGNERDKYDRLLAYVFVDEYLIQDILIKEGLACIAYVQSPSVYFLDKLMLSEKKAKASKVGIWSIENYVSNGRFNQSQ